jgi:hypothetical protein
MRYQASGSRGVTSSRTSIDAKGLSYVGDSIWTVSASSEWTAVGWVVHNQGCEDIVTVTTGAGVPALYSMAAMACIVPSTIL